MVTTTLTTGVSIAQGLWIEAFTTAILVFSVLMLGEPSHQLCPADDADGDCSGREESGDLHGSAHHRVSVDGRTFARHPMDVSREPPHASDHVY